MKCIPENVKPTNLTCTYKAYRNSHFFWMPEFVAPMTQNKQYSAYARSAVADLQQHMDKNPVAYKSISALWEARPGDSRSIIEKAFKPITGYRIKEYLIKVRLEHTKQYLRNGMTIKRAAIKCFYKSQSAYCTAFRRYFNQSPTDWLRDEQQGYQSTG